MSYLARNCSTVVHSRKDVFFVQMNTEGAFLHSVTKETLVRTRAVHSFSCTTSSSWWVAEIRGLSQESGFSFTFRFEKQANSRLCMQQLWVEQHWTFCTHLHVFSSCWVQESFFSSEQEVRGGIENVFAQV